MLRFNSWLVTRVDSRKSRAPAHGCTLLLEVANNAGWERIAPLIRIPLVAPSTFIMSDGRKDRSEQRFFIARYLARSSRPSTFRREEARESISTFDSKACVRTECLQDFCNMFANVASAKYFDRFL